MNAKKSDPYDFIKLISTAVSLRTGMVFVQWYPKQMKLTQIAATLIATATMLNALPAQSNEIYNLNPVARVRTNDIYQDLLKYPDIHCHIAVQVYYSVKAVDERQGLTQNTVDAANAFVSAKCKDSAEAQSAFKEIATNLTFQKESVQMLTAKQFLGLNAAMIELGESW